MEKNTFTLFGMTEKQPLNKSNHTTIIKLILNDLRRCGSFTTRCEHYLIENSFYSDFRFMCMYTLNCVHRS